MQENKLRALLIEDNPGDVVLLKDMLKQARILHLDLTHTRNLIEGLEALKNDTFDVLLLDLGLPESQGIDTFMKIHEQASAIPIIILTGLHDEEIAATSVRGGAQDYLVKGEIDARLLTRSIYYAIERKRAEQDRKFLEERLQRSEKMEALGTLAGGVAHDLNNVLGILVGYSELLFQEIDDASKIKPYVNHIMRSSESAAAIVQDLLTLARRGVHTEKVVNLNTIISHFQQSPEFTKLSAFHPSVQIKTNLEPALLNMTGSPFHISKTLMNLVGNAAESMTDAGIVTITTSNQYLDNPVRGYDDINEGDYVVLTVSDTGEGIPASDLKRIFEPFYTKKVMGRSGTGLGLAVVWGTVKDHDGYIDVQSKENEGTIFNLYFPVTREEVFGDHAPASVFEYMGKGESILVVDDVKEQRELAAHILTRLKYTATAVSSGEEAVAYVKEHPVQLIVLDMILNSVMDGLDTYKRILEIHSKQKAIIVSGFSETDRIKKAQELGAGTYIKKPYVMETLGMAVRRELDIP